VSLSARAGVSHNVRRGGYSVVISAYMSQRGSGYAASHRQYSARREPTASRVAAVRAASPEGPVPGTSGEAGRQAFGRQEGAWR